MTNNPYHPIESLTSTGLVNAGISLRYGGVSKPPYQTLNLATHVGDQPADVSRNQRIFSEQTGLQSFKYCKQIHSDFVMDADCINNSYWCGGNQSNAIETADALISNHLGNTISIFTADCVPIFILDVATSSMGIVHAGWRGTLARIATKTLSQMRSTFGTIPDNCLTHLGPSIQKCCYNVGSDLLLKFEEQFGKSVLHGKSLCLQSAIVTQLVDVGVTLDSISISPYCTSCNTDTFFSHRAEGPDTGRMLSFMQLTER